MQRSSMIRTTRTALLCGAILLLAPLAEAIVVAPHHTFIDHQTRSGVIYLHNPGTEPEEVSISFFFGYPTSDSAGNVTIKVVEDPAAHEPSAADWIRAYPRRAIVAPGGTRALRLLAQPPADLPDGEYWARAVVHSRGGQVPVAAPESEDVRVALMLEVRTVVPVTYRKGDVTTGVLLTEIDHEIKSDSVVARVGMRRFGNAAFLGTLSLTLQDTTGVVLAKVDRHVAVYHQLLKRVSLPTGYLLPGAYTLHARLDTRRSDLDPDLVLPAKAVETSIQVQLP